MGKVFRNAGIYFNSRPHGGRRYKSVRGRTCTDISTHALTEGDRPACEGDDAESYFNSRPHGGRLSCCSCNQLVSCISTHALTEGDHSEIFSNISSGYFNSRPHGGRLNQIKIWIFCPVFQLTPSRRATYGQTSAMLTELKLQLTPSRRATGKYNIDKWFIEFQLTPSRRATCIFLIILKCVV